MTDAIGEGVVTVMERTRFTSISLVRVVVYLLRRYGEKRGMLVMLIVSTIGVRKLWAHQKQLNRMQRGPLVLTPPRPPSKSQPTSKASAGTVGASSKTGSPPAPGGSKQSFVVDKRKAPVRVDMVFFRRLLRVLPVLVPHWRSKESILLITKTALLVARSLLSIHISELIGQGLEAVMRRSPELFLATLSDFFVSGVFASLVNSALKYSGNLMSSWFRENLTRKVHHNFMTDEKFYRATVLANANDPEHRLDNLDQRIVADIHNFTKTLADLYSRTFKPALDVTLCTGSLAKTLGLKGPLLMYSYFMFCSSAVRAVSPPLARLVSQQQAVEGDFRRCHTRLIAHAEEVAFIAGAAKEEAILDEHLLRVSSFAEHLSLQQFYQGAMDQFGFKYLASCVGWPIIALPFIVYEQQGDPVEWVSRYRVADDLIRQGSASFGDLMLVYKKLQTLSGFTARVAELVEALDGMVTTAPFVRQSTPDGDVPIFASGATIKTPDGRTLVAGLDLGLSAGEHLLITGPNGAGKTSLFRTLAGLWPCKEGVVRGPRPAQRELLYLPQTPYLVMGTLRDQVIYPDSTLEASTRMGGLHAVDTAVQAALALAGLERLAAEGVDRVQDEWDDVLSGGEKQRIGWARLFYHCPSFAALDEATSAINVQQEGPLYQACVDKGITMLSIAHRPSVKKFHKWELNIVGDGSGKWALQQIRDVQ